MRHDPPAAPSLSTSHVARGALNLVTHRFYAPDAHETGQRVALPPEEARHLTQVLRLGAGADVRLFDGAGHEFEARVESAARTEVTVATVAQVTPVAESHVQLVLGLGMLRGRKIDDVIRDTTMLGVAAIQPLITARAEAASPGSARRAPLARWRHIAVASAKQSGRAVVPEVAEPLTFELFVRQPAHERERRILLVEPTVGTGHGFRALGATPAPDRATLLIGPEGGWTADEIATAVDAGFTPYTLGARTLRADAAPLAAIAVLEFLWSDG